MAVAVARRGGHAYSLASALVFGGVELWQFLRDAEKVTAHAEELFAVCQKGGFALWETQAFLFGGWAAAHAGGSSDEGTWSQSIERGLAILDAIGGLLAMPYFLSLKIEACLHHHRLPEAREMLERAFAIAAQTRESCWNAELHRLHGELILAETGGGGAEQAEEVFQKGLETARSQGSRGLELRAAVSLGRLWKERRRPAAVCQLLEPLYGWFQEGFATRELQEARALLDACRVAEPASTT